MELLCVTPWWWTRVITRVSKPTGRTAPGGARCEQQTRGDEDMSCRLIERPSLRGHWLAGHGAAL